MKVSSVSSETAEPKKGKGQGGQLGPPQKKILAHLEAKPAQSSDLSITAPTSGMAEGLKIWSDEQ